MRAFTSVLGILLAFGAILPLTAGLLTNNTVMAASSALIIAGGVFIAWSEMRL